MRFFPYFELMPFLPPIELSTCDNRVVGIKLNLTPLRIVFDINPQRSPTVPPPIDIIVEDLSIFFCKSLEIIFQ